MRTRLLTSFFITFAAIIFLPVIMILMGSAPHAQAANFTVTTANDAGVGSLRQAIIDANSNGNPGVQDTIDFAIAGDGAKRIILESGIQISQSVEINGYTQGLATENTVIFPEPIDSLLRIELYFYSVGHIAITSPDVTLRGLSIFDREASAISRLITLDEAHNFKLYGSHIGTDFSGLMAEPSDVVAIAIDIVDSNSVRIGGVSPAERNIFGLCMRQCIVASVTDGNTSDDLRIQGNYLGVGADGLTAFHEQTEKAISILSGVNNTLIGGIESGAGNMISNQNNGAIFAQDNSGLEMYGNLIFLNAAIRHEGINYGGTVVLAGVEDAVIGTALSGGNNNISGTYGGSGIELTNSLVTDNATKNILIEGNTFGYNYDETVPYRNVGYNIITEGDTQDVRIRQNKIHNAEIYPSGGNKSGIRLIENSQRISILQNSIYNNSGIGIELDGASTNDTLDSDTGPNNKLNFPGYTEIYESGGDSEITFTMDVPAGDYRIEFFTNTVAESGAPGEGETYIGFTNVTSNGAGLQEFFHTLTGTGLPNLALTATEILPLSPTGYGATSQFGKEGVVIDREYDVRVSKTLTNLDEVALGNILEYQIVITNDGPDNIDLSDYNAAGPSSILAQDVMAPQIEYSGVSGANIACTDLGAGSAASQGDRYANHTAYSVVNCGFTGPRTYLTSGQSLSFTIFAEVVDDSSLEFYNHVLTFINDSDPDWDDYSAVVVGEYDFIDAFTSVPLNNFATAFSIDSDITISKTLNNPEDVAVGASLNYTLTYTNTGPGPSDLTRFDGSGMNPLLTSLFIDIVPPNITFSSQSNSDIDCFSPGPGSVSMTPYFVNHNDHGLLLCWYIGSAESLASGASISTTITGTVTSEPESFTNFAIAGVTPGDPDYVRVGNAFDIGEDALDELATLNTNNFDTAVYTQVVDASAEITLLNPDDVDIGASLEYEMTYINNGPNAIDPTYFDASGINPIVRSIFLGIAPPNLSYVSQSNPDVSCFWAGPGSASLAPFFANHSTYSLIVCSYVGSDTSLLAGESISTTLTFTADSVPASFSNYVLAGSTSIDPDYSDLQVAFSTNVDMIDYLTSEGMNNLAVATHPIPTPTPSPSGGGSGQSNEVTASGLATTGQTVLAIIMVGVVLVLSGSVLIRRYRRRV